MRFAQVKELEDEKLNRLTGVKKATFLKMVNILGKPIVLRNQKVVVRISLI